MWGLDCTFCTWHVLAGQMWFQSVRALQDSGVAQGKVLSPLLFNILVDGLARAAHVALANSAQMILLSWLTPQRTFQTGLDAVSAWDSDTGSRSEWGNPNRPP